MRAPRSSYPNAFARFQLAGWLPSGHQPPPPDEEDNVITDQLDDVTTDAGDLVIVDA